MRGRLNAAPSPTYEGWVGQYEGMRGSREEYGGKKGKGKGGLYEGKEGRKEGRDAGMWEVRGTKVGTERLREWKL